MPLRILILPRNDPITMMFRILLLALLRLHSLLHLKLVRNINSLLHRRPLLNILQPRFHVWIRFKRNPCPFGPVDPAENANVCNGVFVADDVGGLFNINNKWES